MTLCEETARHLREVHFGGNMTGVNLRDKLADVTWQQATLQVGSFHSIATLVFHLNYYVSGVLNVLQGGTLDIHDRFSFDCPPVESQEDWDALLDKTWTDTEAFASLVEQLPASQLEEAFVDGKYGSWYRNLPGLIEHCHYHLGQIAMTKSLVAAQEDQE